VKRMRERVDDCDWCMLEVYEVVCGGFDGVLGDLKGRCVCREVLLIVEADCNVMMMMERDLLSMECTAIFVCRQSIEKRRRLYTNLVFT
jgi:hypothetical protein